VLKPIAGLGPVRVTSDYNYVRFLLASLFALAVFIALGWAYGEGYVTLVNRLQTWVFTTVFSLLLCMGMMRGLIESWHYSHAIDALKRATLSTDELKQLLGIHDLSERSVDLLQSELEDEAFRRIEKIENIAVDASQVGIFGTVLGVMLAIRVVADKVRSVEDALTSLPEIAHFLGVAFATTLVGILVSRVVLQFARMARDSAMAFTHRVARTLHDHLVNPRG